MMQAIGWIILLNLAVYGRTINYDMVIDDNCRKFHVKDLHKNWLVRLYRLTKYSGHGGFSLKIDHSLSLMLHILVCIAIYIVFGSNFISFISALLFSVQPVNNQVSIWLNGKRFSIISLLILLMWYFTPYGMIFYVLTPIWHYGALPAVLLYLFTSYKWLLWLIFIPLLIFYKKIINKIGTRWEAIPIGEIKRLHPRKFVIFIKMFGYIFLHCLFPRRMSFYHMFMERFGFSDEDNKYWYSFNKDFWKGGVIIISIIVIMILNWFNPIGFGLFWWTIFILPWCQFPLGITQAISERTYYLSNIGLMYALSYTLLHIPYGEYIISAVFVYYLTRLWFYIPAYKNLNEFYRYALHEFPEHFRARAHVIQKDLQENKVFYCLHNCGVGIRYHPKDCTLNLLMCQSLMALGAFPKAEEYLAIARVNLVPGHEKKLIEVINNFQHIITEMINKMDIPKHIKPTDVVEIKSSQIAGG